MIIPERIETFTYILIVKYERASTAMEIRKEIKRDCNLKKVGYQDSETRIRSP